MGSEIFVESFGHTFSAFVGNDHKSFANTFTNSFSFDGTPSSLQGRSRRSRAVHEPKQRTGSSSVGMTLTERAVHLTACKKHAFDGGFVVNERSSSSSLLFLINLLHLSFQLIQIVGESGFICFLSSVKDLIASLGE